LEYANGQQVQTNLTTGDRVWRTDDDDADLVRVQTKDGAEYDQFQGDLVKHGFEPDEEPHKPKHEVSFDYANGQQVKRDLKSGDEVTRGQNGEGPLLHIRTGQGAEYDQFDGDLIKHGYEPDVDKTKPRHEVKFEYANGQQHKFDLWNGNQVWRAENGAGALTFIHTGEGAQYDKFDGERLLHGWEPDEDKTKPRHEVVFDYKDGVEHKTDLTNGDQIWRNEESGAYLKVHTGFGAEFDRFDKENRPLHGWVSGKEPDDPREEVNFDYPAAGVRHDTYLSNGTQLWWNGDQITRQINAVGWDIKYADGIPVSGARVNPDTGKPEVLTITNNADGTSMWQYPDYKVWLDKDHNPTRLETADGAAFTQFDKLGRPTVGTMNGVPVTIAYDDLRHLVHTKFGGDGNVAEIVRTEDGNIVEFIKKDGTHVSFSVALDQLRQAITTIGNCQHVVELGMTSIGSELKRVQDAWGSPGGTTFEYINTEFGKVSTEAMTVFKRTITAMTAAYDNYVDSETTNVNNNRRWQKSAGPPANLS
jgi:hypothetical protein